MADLMDDIGEDLRREQLKKFWKENGNWIVGGVLLAILATGAMSFWRNHEYQENLVATTELLSVAHQSDAGKLAAFAQKSDKDHATVAQFLAAGLYQQGGDKNKAAEIYAEIEKTAGVDRVYRDLAALYGVLLELETGDLAVLHKTLDRLTGDENVWRFTALEAKALLFARQGQADKAAEILMRISGDAAAPADARTRAYTLHELYAGGEEEKK